MKGLFNPDNPIQCLIGKCADICIISLAWFVCSLPIITIGPASTALYYSVVKNIHRDRGRVLNEFWRSFCSNFKQGIIVSVVLIAVSALMLFVEIPVIMATEGTASSTSVMRWIFIIAKIVILAGTVCWVYPLLSRFEITGLQALKNAVLLALRYFFKTLLFAIIIAASVLMIIVIKPTVLVAPALVSLLLSKKIEPVFKKLCEERNLQGELSVWAG